MELLRILSQKGEQKGISFILIGGHALNVYGLPRQTGDVDLVIQESDREEWKNIVSELGYTIYNDHKAFIQFTPPALTEWPVDLIIVDADTFNGLKEDGREEIIDGIRIIIPSVEHLIALKLHALKQDPADRELKDLDDILGLIEITDIDVQGEEFKSICRTFGTDAIYTKIVELLEKRNNDT